MVKREPTARYQAVVELRRSNAAQPIPSGKQYRRCPKNDRQFLETY